MSSRIYVILINILFKRMMTIFLTPRSNFLIPNIVTPTWARPYWGYVRYTIRCSILEWSVHLEHRFLIGGYETREKLSETNQVSSIKNEGGKEYIGVQRILVITLYGIDGVQQRIKLQKRYNLLQQCPKEEIMFQERRMTLWNTDGRKQRTVLRLPFIQKTCMPYIK